MRIFLTLCALVLLGFLAATFNVYSTQATFGQANFDRPICNGFEFPLGKSNATSEAVDRALCLGWVHRK